VTFSRPAARPGWQQRAWILGCAIAAVLPLAIQGNSCGHDFDFHLQSWLAVAQQWHHGVIYPHWIDGANYGAGEPRLVFYPPFSWMLGALLGTVLPWNAVPIAFTLIVMAACGFSMKNLAAEYLPANAATFAACAYILNPYALFVAYERTAYGELAAGIWLPLIVLYALRAQPGLRHPGRSAVVPLALTIAAIWLTNAPAAVMSCYLLAGIALWKLVSEKRWQAVFQVFSGLMLGLGLAAFYLVPAAYERRWVDIARAIGPGMRIEDSFLFGHTGESFHDQVLRSASWIFISMLVTLAVSGWIAWKRNSARPWLLPLFITAGILLALQLPWSRTIWLIAPEIKFLQFPWRLSLILSMGFGLTLGAAAIPRQETSASRSVRLRIATALLVAVALIFTAARFFWQPCDDEDAVSAQVALFNAGTGFEGTDEYTPIGADNSLIQHALPQVRLLTGADAETSSGSIDESEAPQYIPEANNHISAQVQIAQWQPERISLSIATQSPGFAVLRLMDYPARRVFANARPIEARPHREDGLMTIPIATGTTRIEISYRATSDVAWGRGLSIASCLALIALTTTARNRDSIE
jgi:hypothetical protein